MAFGSVRNRVWIGLSAVFFVLCSQLLAENQISLQGAGATFPYPLYSRWAYEYNGLSGVKVNYQSIGSGGGIAQIKARTVDFGASDAPLKKEELDAAGLVQFPMVVGGVVVVVNLEGIGAGDIKLSSSALAKIFLGEITNWSDPEILKDNPGIKMPHRKITVVHRADGSGTTWIFTNYLSKISAKWKDRVGTGKAVNWPVGIGGKGNEGVSAYVQRVKGSIGYVEYAYASSNKLAYALLQNSSGSFVAPSIKAFQAAAANADWKSAPGFYVILTNQPGKESWPITGASFILLPQQNSSCKKTKAMLKFFEWCYAHGKDTAIKLSYVPIPDNVASLVSSMWSKEVACEGKQAWNH